MFTIKEERDGNTLTMTLEGKITSKTAPELDAALSGKYDGLEKLIFDFEKLEYLTSAGLRVILTAQQEMEDRDALMVLRNVNSDIQEVFRMTGFGEVLTIE